MKPGNLFYIRCQFLTDECMSEIRELHGAVFGFFCLGNDSRLMAAERRLI